jgi:hypothetical protein
MKIKINESKLNRIVEDSMNRFIQQQEQQKKWFEEEKALYDDFANFLSKNGVPGVKVYQKHGGSLCISIGSDDYRNYNVERLSRMYAEPRHLYVSEDEYPATTYIWLNNY